MHTIIVKKDGLYIKEHLGYDKYSEVKVHSFLPYLNATIEIEDGVTFGDFFEHIMRQHAKYSQVFASHLGNYKLSAWQEEWDRLYIPKENDDWDYTMTHLEVVWDANAFTYKKGDTEINIGCQFHGSGVDNKTGKSVGIAVEFTPLNELKQYPLKLDTQFNLYNQHGPEILASGYQIFTVFDVVSTILYEISFSGAPESRDAQIAEINRRAEEVKNGTAELIPMEEVFDRLKERFGENDESDS